MNISEARKIVAGKKASAAKKAEAHKLVTRANAANLKGKLTRFGKRQKGKGKEQIIISKSKGNKLRALRDIQAAKKAALAKPGFLRSAEDLVAIAARRNPMSLKKAKALLSRKRKPGRPSFEQSCKLATARRVVAKHNRKRKR